MSVSLDLRYAIRSLGKSPTTTILAGLTLALGIGGPTAMFSAMRAAFLTSLPFPEENRLVMIWQGSERELVTPANFVNWKERNSSFEAMGAWPTSSDIVTDFVVSRAEGSERVHGTYVTSGFFRVLGVPPLMGRAFNREEDRQQGGQRSAILSHSYWQTRFGGDPGVLGKTLKVDTFRGGVYTIVGVMPASFDFPSGAQIFLPIAYWGGGPLPLPDSAQRCCSWFSVIGRLKPGVSIEAARSDLNSISQHKGGVKMSTLRTEMVGSQRTTLLILSGAVLCILLIACTNVAILSMSKAVASSSEMAVRSALGAGTPQLVRLVFLESLLLSTIGAAAGLLSGMAGLEVLKRGLGATIPLIAGAGMDWGVLLFTIVVSAGAACACSIWPAVQLRSGRLTESTRSHTMAPQGRRLQQVLMAGEVALAVTLIVVAGLLARTLLQLKSVDPGFRKEQVLAVTFDLTSSSLRGPGRQQPWFHELMTSVSRLPGVQQIGGVSEAPLMRRRLPDQTVTVEGQPHSFQVIQRAVTPDYFRAMAIPLRSGRFFAESDSGEGRLVAIVNETAARRLWPGADPVGRQIAMGSAQRYGYFRVPPAPGRPEWREVVGVVADVRSSSLDLAPQPEVFYSYQQYSWYSPTLLLRTAGDPLALASEVRKAAKALNAQAVVTDVRSVEQIASDSVRQPRFRAFVTGVFGALAMLLGAMGIYGVISYSAVQRTREIGIRMALGATPFQAAWLVARQAMVATGVGLAAGTGAAYVVGQSLSSMLFGVESADPMTMVGACALFGLSAVAASFVPARRAASVDPGVAVRSE